ncbi:thiamine ABC transporter substrate-binding protein [Saccharopolyspora cebuensis]|uniref:Thiamine ABC transporter substrate binding subunit n=1 Tax=Saccharopolyspora cebuensis TaxID=418759 RepID=A0ABV4CLY8_9PSEU
MKRSRLLAGATALVAFTTGCSLIGDEESAGRAVTLVTHDSFAVDEALLARFERESGIDVRVVPSGDAGELTNELVLTKDAPIGDVAYGVDSTFASRALRADVFAPHPTSATGPERYALGDGQRLTAVDVADVCVNVDTGWFADRGIPAPATLRDLTDPRYRDLFAVPDPSTSSPGLAFLLATVAEFGEDGWADYWRALMANGAKLSSGWEAAYGQDFSGSTGQGPRPIVLSYASSPAAEVRPDGTPRTKALLDTCYRQVEYAGVLRGTDDPDAAGQVVDFLLSPEFQAQVAERMYVYPAVTGVPLPDGWQRTAPLPERSAELPPEQVERNRDRWVREWREVVRG